MWGVVPRIPNVATGVSTLHAPGLGDAAGDEGEGASGRLIRVELSLPSGS